LKQQNDSPAVWQGNELVRSYLQNIRAGIPYGVDQIAMALRVASSLRSDVSSVLDLGCGDGIVGFSARQIWPGARLTLVDFSMPMLDAARVRFAGEQGVAFIDVDFGAPHWIEHIADRAPFDLVVSAYAIHHQEDDRKRTLYHEISELLAPGGVFINIEHVQSATPALEAVWNRLLVETLIAQHPERNPAQVEREFAVRPDRFANRLAPLETQLDWLRDAGLLDVDCYFKILELAVFGGRKPNDEDAQPAPST